MVEVTGEIWDYLGKAVIAVTTSGSVSKAGRAVMHRGVAKQAAQRFPELPGVLGQLIQEFGSRVQPLGHGIVSFPVEATAWEWADLAIVARSARELRELADREEWETIVVPRPGCGGGGLNWKEVRPLLEPHFDARFTVIEGGVSGEGPH